MVIVDAHPLMRAGVRAVLDAAPDIQFAGDASGVADAIRLSQELRPDVVIVGIDGSDDVDLETVRAIAALETSPRIVAVTIFGEEDTLVHALRAGANALISRESSEAELPEALRMAAAGEVYVPRRALSLLAATARRPVRPVAERAAHARYRALSERERAVLGHVAAGLTGPEIGRLLAITAKTVDTYRHRINEKLGLQHRADYVRFALIVGCLKK